MSYIKSLYKFETVDINVVRKLAQAEARIWIKANYPNEPRWTDRYKMLFQKFVEGYINNSRRQAVKH